MKSLNDMLKVEKGNENIVVCSYFSFFCSGMLSTILGTVLPLLREEYGITYGEAGMLTSTMQLFQVIGSLVVGYLPIMFGKKKATLMTNVGMFSGVLLVTLTGNPIFLLLAYALIGWGRGGMQINNALIQTYTGNGAAGVNVLHAMSSFGCALAPFLALLSSSWNWRVSCWIISALSLVSFVLFSRSTLPTVKETRGKGGSGVPKSFDFWLTALIMLAYLAAESCIMNFLVSYIMERGLFGGVWAMASQSVLWLMILAGRLTCAAVSSKVNKPRLILGLGIGMTVSFTVLINTSNPVITLLAVIGTGISMSGLLPTNLATLPDQYRKDALASGICMAVGNIGGIVMPHIVGGMADRTGSMEGGFRLIIGALVLMLILIVIKVIRSRKAEA